MMGARDFFVRKVEPRKGTCFVLMPFQDAMTAVYEHGIRPLVESLGMQCRRADELYTGQSILGDLWASIQSAEIIIADLSGKNPNVMYELGLCHALWKRVILLCQNKDDVPFDLRAWRVIWYDFTFAGSARLKDELKRAIEALRIESDIECELVPMRKAIGPNQSKTNTAPVVAQETVEWQNGVVDSWKEAGFGFIRNISGESFYFNRDYMYGDFAPPDRESRVIFLPLEPLEPGKNRRASNVLVLGAKVCARITKIIRGKGYGFGELEGQRGEVWNIFLLFSVESSLSVGDEVECAIELSPKGLVGRDARLLSRAE